MVELPKEQLQAISDFWAERYMLEATVEQLENFRAILQVKVVEALQKCIWDESNLMRGTYGRKFITFHEYYPSATLSESLKQAGLKSSSLAFPWGLILAIDPGSVKVHPTGEVIWEATLE